jgi:hypothetical protein
VAQELLVQRRLTQAGDLLSALQNLATGGAGCVRALLLKQQVEP